MMTAKTIEKIDAREIRRKLGLNQQQFWSTLGVTQSGGSRYESGRNMPKPVRELLRLVHVEQIDIKNIKHDDWEVIEYLKAQEPELFKSLKKSARSHAKKAARASTGFCFCGEVDRSNGHHGETITRMPVSFVICSANSLSCKVVSERKRGAAGCNDGRASPYKCTPANWSANGRSKSQ